MVKCVSHTVNVGPLLFCGEIRGHRVFGDLPEDLGGHDTGMDPFEGLLVALGNCLGMVIAQTCQARGVDYAGLTLDVEADVDSEARRLDNFRVKVHMPGPLDDKTRRAVAAGERLCRVRNTLRHDASVEVELADG
jgi:uncharacterized OsmC-like protein